MNQKSDEFLEAHTNAESLKYTAPGMAMAHTFAKVSSEGSPKAKKQARILSWIIIGILLLTAVPLIASFV